MSGAPVYLAGYGYKSYDETRISIVELSRLYRDDSILHAEIAFFLLSMMAETVGLASAVIGLGTLAKSCQGLYNVISRIKKASKHIDLLSRDLKDLCIILDTLQALFNDNEFLVGSLASLSRFEDLEPVRDICMSILNDIRTMVDGYKSQGTSADLGTWKRLQWTFKEKEIEGYRKDLVTHKMTLNIAISVANM